MSQNSKLGEEAAILLIEQLLEGIRSARPSLSDLDRRIIEGTLQRIPYKEIARDSECSPNYVKQEGYYLWSDLSKAMGVDVSKPRLQEVLERWVIEHSEAEMLPDKVQPTSNILSHLKSTAHPREDSDPTEDEALELLPPVLGEYLRLPRQVFGREGDLKALQKAFQPSVARLQCVFLTGALGIGKTTLAAKFAATATGFEKVAWLSLYDQPPLDSLLVRLLSYLGTPVVSTDRQALMEQLKQLLQSSRCLIALNGYDRVLNEIGYEGFLGQVVETRHQSCFLLVSDQRSPIIEDWQHIGLSIQSFEVKPISAASSYNLLSAEGITDITDQRSVFDLYGGNPFLLLTAAKSIRTLFNGNTAEFLEVTTTLYTTGIRNLLSPVFEQLTQFQKMVLLCLSRSSTTTPLQLREEIDRLSLSSSVTGSLFEAVETLRYWGLVEIKTAEGSKQQTIYFLQPMIRKHVLNLFSISG